MRSTIVLLFPFDLGLELDFTGKDAKEFFKEISTHKIGTLSAAGKVFSQAEFSTQVYKFGVGLIQISFVVEEDIPALAGIACDIEKIRVGKTGISSYCRSLVDGLIQRAEKYATHRYDQRLTDAEILPVFVLAEPPSEDANGFIQKHQKVLYGLLAGEKDFDRLSSFVMEQEKLVNYGYYENEIIMIKRFGALVSSKESSIIVEMIKLAYAQYWSLRSYNSVLDHEIDTAKLLLDHLPPFYNIWVMPQAYNRFSKEAIDFDKDKITIVDSLYNTMTNIPQVESDWHLKTLHQSVNKVFDIEELHKTVETKIGRIAESYNSARETLSNNFFIILDIIFFLSLIWSVLDTVLLFALYAK